MLTVHWWALAGLVWFIFGTWMIIKSHDIMCHSYENRRILRVQLEMLREAIALSKYGAEREAQEMVDMAVRLKPQWDINEI